MERFSSFIAVILLLAGICAWPEVEGQECSSARALSSQPFGFKESAGQGVNSSYVYLVFIMNVTGNGASPLQCSSVAASRNSSLIGMQKVQAAMWAVDSFRVRYSSLLPGVTVGALVLDTCQSVPLTVLQLSNLQSCETTFGSSSMRVQPGSTVSFIGVETLAEAMGSMPLFNSIGKAVISYELKADLSLNSSSFPLLVRLSPGDAAEAMALAEAISSVGAKQAQIVFSSSSQSMRYMHMADAVERRLNELGVCVVNKVQFTSSAAASVNGFSTVRPVVLLLNSIDMRSFAAEMLALRPASGTFTWLLPSDNAVTISELTSGRENFFAGAVLLGQQANASSYDSFQSYFKTLTPSTSGMATMNPWFGNFWSNYFRCNLRGSSSTTFASTCNYEDSSQNLQANPSFGAASARIIQAVDLALHALDLTRSEICGSASTGLCSSFLSRSTRFQSLYSNLFNASLSVEGVSPLTSDGGQQNYTLLVHNYQKSYPGHLWRSVGSYQSGHLALTSSLQAYGTDQRNTSWSSVCDAACVAACSHNSSTTLMPTTSSAITSSMSSLFGAPGTFRRQYWVYALIACAFVGIVVSLIFLCYIIKMLIGLPSELKSFSTIWSGQTLIIIIIIGYITLFAWTPWPNREACGVIRFMVGFVYAGMFSILLVKLLNLTNAFLPPEYQLLLFCLALAAQVATAVQWLILVPSEVSVSASGSQCNHSFLDHLQALVYSMLLILICTLLAVKAHSVGKNNREAVFIGCAAGISIPIWITWSLVGSLNSGQDFKDASLAFGLFINLTLVLLVIFLPKIHQLRRLEKDSAEEEEDHVDYGQQIYVLSPAAPSVYSDGSIFMSPRPASMAGGQIVAVPDLKLSSQLRSQSVAGDRPHTVSKTPTLSRDLQGQHHPKAYANFKDSLKPDVDQLDSLPRTNEVYTSPTTKNRLSKLGFI